MQPPSLITAQSKGLLESMLMRGFTTVRDAAGADFDLQEAGGAQPVRQGRGCTSPRSRYPQTGDRHIRKGTKEVFCTCRAGSSAPSPTALADVRRAVREQVRNGANQIKGDSRQRRREPDRSDRRSIRSTSCARSAGPTPPACT